MPLHLCNCAVVELTDSLLTATLLLALKRFAARRTVPSVVYSDNAATFAAAKSRLLVDLGHLCFEWKNIVLGLHGGVAGGNILSDP